MEEKCVSVKENIIRDSIKPRCLLILQMKNGIISSYFLIENVRKSIERKECLIQ